MNKNKKESTFYLPWKKSMAQNPKVSKKFTTKFLTTSTLQDKSTERDKPKVS